MRNCLFFTSLFPTWPLDQIRTNQFLTTSRMDSFTHAAVISVLITHIVVIHCEKHNKQNQGRTTAHRLPILKYTVGRCNDKCRAKRNATYAFSLFRLFCTGRIDEPCWKQRDRAKFLTGTKVEQNIDNLPVKHFLSGSTSVLELDKSAARPQRSRGCCLLAINCDWLLPGLAARMFLRWKSLGVECTHASYIYTYMYILERSTLTPRVVWQSDFCFCI